jgi:hypothetical protein
MQLVQGINPQNISKTRNNFLGGFLRRRAECCMMSNFLTERRWTDVDNLKPGERICRK